jgi:hypothetical protein
LQPGDPEPSSGPVKPLFRFLFAVLVLVLVSWPAAAGIDDGPDVVGVTLSAPAKRLADHPAVTYSATFQKGTVDAGVGLYTPAEPERVPTEQECWSGCNVQPHNGCALQLAEPGEACDGTPTCHCVFVCGRALFRYW